MDNVTESRALEKYRNLGGMTLFFLLYMIAFICLERRDVKLHLIHTAADELIPFCAYFILPYVSWYAYVALTVIWFALHPERQEEYRKLAATICLGSIIFLFISFVYPNGHDLRPQLEGDGWCIRLVRLLYFLDTPTNILPSLHVFLAAACCIAICKTRINRHPAAVKGMILTLTVLIILSTMLLKQHTVIDVLLALLFNVVCYWLFYIIIPRLCELRHCAIRYTGTEKKQAKHMCVRHDLPCRKGR